MKNNKLTKVMLVIFLVFNSSCAYKQAMDYEKIQQARYSQEVLDERSKAGDLKNRKVRLSSEKNKQQSIYRNL